MNRNIETCPKCGKPLAECAKRQNRFGASFREIREENGRSAEGFAAILDIDVSEINEIECGSKDPTVDQLVILAQHIGISPFDFTHRALDKSKYFHVNA